MKLSELMLASSGGLKIEKRPMWSGVERCDPFIRLANDSPFKAEDRIVGFGGLALPQTGCVWGHNGSEYLAILPGLPPRTVSYDFKTTTVRSAIGAAPANADRFKIIGFINSNWIVLKLVGSTNYLYRSPDNGVTWVSMTNYTSSYYKEPTIFGERIYLFDASSATVNVYDTNTWTALASETLPAYYSTNSIRKSKNGNVLVYNSNNQWFKKIGTGSWTACPYIADQVASAAEILTLGQSDFIFFDMNVHKNKRISRWSPTTDTLTFLPNFSVETDLPLNHTFVLDDTWAGNPVWPTTYSIPNAFLDIDEITHIPIRYIENTEYDYDGTVSTNRVNYVYAILSTYNGESFTVTGVGSFSEAYVTNYSYRFFPAIGGGFFFTDLDNRVNTINTNCQEIVHVL